MLLQSSLLLLLNEEPLAGRQFAIQLGHLKVQIPTAGCSFWALVSVVMRRSGAESRVEQHKRHNVRPELGMTFTQP